ncbi:MAG TPA: peptidoglycan-binding domain-containing protein [Paracoccaceae bacterium]|nr:peptidoglycan-binding domain-containing protein [Paracoccaceae bacterium]HMO71406.1 peptidoglycan-binding domain-containing protein [Paracoccaceae bacterium]
MAVLAEPDTSSEVVQEAQKLLNQSSRQSRAPENGAFDRSTLAAIKQFQIESGLRPTGVLDDKLMDVLRKAAKEEQPKWQVTLNGKVYLLTEADHKALIKRVQGELREPVQKLRGAVIEARANYDHMKKLNDDQYIVSWCIEAWNRTKLPSEGVIKSAENGVKAAEQALSSGNLKAFASIYPKAQTEANKAREAMKKYIAQMIDGGESLAGGLEFVRDGAFVTVAVIAAPVAASYGAGAIAAGVIAGAGSAAVESIANEVGKHISGTNETFGDSALNVLKDSFIGGSIGAVIKGGAADKLIKAIGPKLAAKVGGEMLTKASSNAVGKFMLNYLKNHGKDALEGIMKETLKSFKSTSQPLTVDKFIGIVVKELATAGPFKALDNLGQDKAFKKIFEKMSPKVREKALKELGKGASEADLFKTFSSVYGEFYKHGAGKVYDMVLNKLTGAETPDRIEKDLVQAFAYDAKLIAEFEKECQKQGKKTRK